VLGEIRSVRATEPEGAGLAREVRTDREAESLVAWADARGVLIERQSPPKEDELTGGEHLVEINEDSGLVFKTTKPGKFGYAADREMIRPRNRKEMPRITVGLADATPYEYLSRLDWQNEHFGDEIRVLGLARSPSGISILTSQPFYLGTRTDQQGINQWFNSKGWLEVLGKDGAFYHPGIDLLILDALPRNVLTLDDGRTMPFDVVIVHPNKELKSSLKL
jgi:hypothetical protein